MNLIQKVVSNKKGKIFIGSLLLLSSLIGKPQDSPGEELSLMGNIVQCSPTQGIPVAVWVHKNEYGINNYTVKLCVKLDKSFNPQLDSEKYSGNGKVIEVFLKTGSDIPKFESGMTISFRLNEGFYEVGKNKYGSPIYSVEEYNQAKGALRIYWPK